MPITFREIPPTTRIPGRYVELNTRLAARGLPNAEAVVVLLGQKTSAGSAAVAEMVQIVSDSDAEDYFGAGSQLHRMALAALEANPYMSALWAVPVDDNGSGVAATGTFTFTIASLTAGTLTIFVGDDGIDVTITASMTANQIAAAVEAALDDHPELPVTAGVATNVVTVTAKNDGLLGNQIDLSAEFDGSGLTVAVVAMSGGLTDPSLTASLDAIFAANVDVIVHPWNDATTLGNLVDHLDDRSDGIEQRGAVGISAIDTTVSAATTIAVALNSGRVSLALCQGTKTWAPELAAAYAAAIAGEPDLARPLNGVTLEGVAIPEASTDIFLRSELTTLLANGVTPIVIGPQSDARILRSITTYVEDSNGAPDDTLLDLQTIRVLDWLRRAIKTRLDSRFSQVKIADVAHTENTTDCATIRGEILSVLYAAEEIDYLEAVEDNADGVVVVRNADDRTRVDATIPADVVNGLHVLATRIDLIL